MKTNYQIMQSYLRDLYEIKGGNYKFRPFKGKPAIYIPKEKLIQVRSEISKVSKWLILNRYLQNEEHDLMVGDFIY